MEQAQSAGPGALGSETGAIGGQTGTVIPPNGAHPAYGGQPIPNAYGYGTPPFYMAGSPAGPVNGLPMQMPTNGAPMQMPYAPGPGQAGFAATPGGQFQLQMGPAQGFQFNPYAPRQPENPYHMQLQPWQVQTNGGHPPPPPRPAPEHAPNLAAAAAGTARTVSSTSTAVVRYRPHGPGGPEERPMLALDICEQRNRARQARVDSCSERQLQARMLLARVLVPVLGDGDTTALLPDENLYNVVNTILAQLSDLTERCKDLEDEGKASHETINTLLERNADLVAEVAALREADSGGNGRGGQLRNVAQDHPKLKVSSGFIIHLPCSPPV